MSGLSRSGESYPHSPKDTTHLLIFLTFLVLLTAGCSYMFFIEPTLKPLKTKEQMIVYEEGKLMHGYVYLSPKIRLKWKAEPKYNEYSQETTYEQILNVETYKSGRWYAYQDLPPHEIVEELNSIHGIAPTHTETE